MPARDSARTIDAALASVAAQSSLPGEVVVVDDGSVDRTAELARRWEDRLPLRMLRNAHAEGPAVARNRAIQATQKPLLATLDADDVWLPDHLQALLELGPCPGRIVTAQVLRWLPGVGVKIDSRRSRVPHADQRLAILIENFVIQMTVFSRVDWQNVGGYRSGVMEDWDLWIRMLRTGVRVINTSHPTALYRLSHGSRSTDGIDLEVATLRSALTEAGDDEERQVAHRSLRMFEGRHSLLRAYEASRTGHYWSARRHAVLALRGPRGVQSRSCLLLAAPRFGSRLREKQHSRVERWLTS